MTLVSITLEPPSKPSPPKVIVIPDVLSPPVSVVSVSLVSLLASPECSTTRFPVAASNIRPLVVPVVTPSGSNPPTVLASTVRPVYVLFPS